MNKAAQQFLDSVWWYDRGGGHSLQELWAKIRGRVEARSLQSDTTLQELAIAIFQSARHGNYTEPVLLSMVGEFLARTEVGSL